MTNVKLAHLGALVKRSKARPVKGQNTTQRTKLKPLARPVGSVNKLREWTPTKLTAILNNA